MKRNAKLDMKFHMKKILLPILTLMFILSLSACAGSVAKTPSPTPGTPSSSESQNPDTDKTPEDNNASSDGKTSDDDRTSREDESDPAISSQPTLETLQGLYAKAPEYQYMAIGYYQDPQHPDMVRDGYVPYVENYTQENLDSLQAKAHGISIRLHMTSATSASAAVEELKTSYLGELQKRDISPETDETMSYDNDTLAVCPVAYYDEAGNPVIAFLYADIRDDGTVYMCAEIEYHVMEFDNVTAAMLPEIDDVYALNFSSIFEVDENATN